MGDLYRVIVFHETPDDSGDYVQDTLVELAAPREMLAQFAPQAVAAALGTTAQDATPPKMAMEGPAETPEQATQRRKRRTKAEMEAARAAEAAAPLGAIVSTPGVVYDEPVPMPAESSPTPYDPFGRG